jgi:hypothetical protein
MGESCGVAMLPAQQGAMHALQVAEAEPWISDAHADGDALGVTK